jgi:hypothetical protein
MPDAHTGPMPRVEEEVFDQAQYADEEPPEPAASAEAAEAAEPAQPEDPHLPLDVPADPDPSRKLTNLGVARRDEHTESKASRRTVPSWDDIMLGVRRNRD